MLFLSHFPIFSWGEKRKEMECWISSCKDMAIFQQQQQQKHIKKQWCQKERTLTFSRKMNYSVTFRMHALSFNTCKQQKRVSGLLGTITRIQEPILVFWSTHDEGMCSLILVRVREHGGITNKQCSPTAFLRRTKKKKNTPQIEAQQVSPQ